MGTMTVLQKYQKIGNHMSIEIHMMVIGRTTNKVIMTQKETGRMILLEDQKMMTYMDLMIIMIQIKSI